MARVTTSKTQKTDVAKPSTVAAENAVTEKVDAVAEAKTDATTEEKAESQEAENAVTEKPEQNNKDGLPFKVNSDGTVNVWSEKRAGRSVTGSTGEVVTFDDKGFAKVKLEDALHFKEVPGFSFKE